jgi:hypothetical protein
MFFFEKKNQTTFVWLVAAALTLTRPAVGQEALPNVVTPQSADMALAGERLQALLAPVALYPDPVLSDILAAATFPAQVVEAERFASDPANAGLQGQALLDAGSRHGWDQSVVSLLAFPTVLQMMDRDLEWTEQLGRAFSARPEDVLAAVQTLRQEAQANGTLVTGPDASVVNDGGNIAIYPPSPEQVVLPAYDPGCVYDLAAGCVAAPYEIVWSGAVFLPYGFRHWGLVDWRLRCLRTYAGGNWNAPQYGAVWRAPAHAQFLRRNVADSLYHYAPPASAPYAQRSARPEFQGGRPSLPLVNAGVVRRPQVRQTSVAVAHGGMGHVHR